MDQSKSEVKFSDKQLYVAKKAKLPAVLDVKYEMVNENAALPEQATVGSAGYDAKASLLGPKGSGRDIKMWDPDNNQITLRAENGSISIPGGWRALIPMGFKAKVPDGYECQVRPRSGLALKNGISILNSPGTIDSDYFHEWGSILINTSNIPFVVNDGDRVAQLVFSAVPTANWFEGEVKQTTDRKGGLGSTGK